MPEHTSPSFQFKNATAANGGQIFHAVLWRARIGKRTQMQFESQSTKFSKYLTRT